MTDAGKQPELRSYLHQVWRWKWVLLALVVLIPAATYLFTKRVPKTYEASATLEVRKTEFSSSLFSNQFSFSASGAEAAARFIKTTAVARAATKELGEPPSQARSLLGQISVKPDEEEETGFLTITAQSQSPDRAAAVANAFAGAITSTRTEDAIKQIEGTIATLSRQSGSGDAADRQELRQQIQQLQGLRASQADTTRVIEPAAAPSSPVSPNPRRNTALAFVLSLFLAAGLVPLLQRLDRHLRDPDELEELAGSPLLGTVPEAAFPGRPPSPQVREAFQTLRAGLTYFNVDRTLASVIVTSPIRADGKTTVATSLAIALAQDGRNVILIDGDMRRPQVATRLGVTDQVHVGLDAVLLETGRLGDALVELEIERGRLRILPGGSLPPNPSVLLGSEQMKLLISELSERADIVIVDTPPILSVSDAIPLLKQVSGAVLVARMDHTTRDGLLKARQMISAAGGQLLGVVATGARTGRLYRYGYGYGYGYEADAAASDGFPGEMGANGAKRRRLRLPGWLGGRSPGREQAAMTTGLAVKPRPGVPKKPDARHRADDEAERRP